VRSSFSLCESKGMHRCASDHVCVSVRMCVCVCMCVWLLFLLPYSPSSSAHSIIIWSTGRWVDSRLDWWRNLSHMSRLWVSVRRCKDVLNCLFSTKDTDVSTAGRKPEKQICRESTPSRFRQCPMSKTILRFLHFPLSENFTSHD
jgi:hypothetical protein